MADTLETDFALVPPTAERVAARALVLAAVSGRCLIEKDAGKAWAELLRQQIYPWLERTGVTGELEQAELALINTPLGKLDKKTLLAAAWHAEGMVVLAWALGRSELPDFYTECDPSSVANSISFLDERENTPLPTPKLRDFSEIERLADTYLAVSWRLSQFNLQPQPMDFVNYAATCEGGPLRLDGIKTLAGDLSIAGIPLHTVDHVSFKKARSIASERRRAFDWLLGFHPIYSAVASDT